MPEETSTGPSQRWRAEVQSRLPVDGRDPSSGTTACCLPECRMEPWLQLRLHSGSIWIPATCLADLRDLEWVPGSWIQLWHWPNPCHYRHLGTKLGIYEKNSTYICICLCIYLPGHQWFNYHWIFPFIMTRDSTAGCLFQNLFNIY